jgi:hypothetical protein
LSDDIPNSEPNPAAEAFYSGALDRITRMMPILALIAIVLALVLCGWRIALGLVCGCAIAYLNFHWLKHAVTTLADKVTQFGKPTSGKRAVFRFILRYLLMAAAAYAIFTVSPASLYGLFVGLFLPVAAIACEAAYEAYAALARGL